MGDILLKTNNLKQGMTISQDVICEDGTFLVPANTLVTKNLILKLQLYKVPYVYTKESNKPKEENSLSLKQTPVFQNFQKEYQKKTEAIEREFSNIVNTGAVDTASLFSHTLSVLEETKITKNAFNFLCRLQSKNDIIFSHCLNVSILANIFSKWLDLPKEDQENLTIAGMLHDIGKIKIDESILKKTDKLSANEEALIQQHPALGYDMLENSDLEIGIKQAILMHHKDMNDMGYPKGISWEQVHPYAKIISIVDIYDDMTSDHPYHKRYHPFHVIRMFEEEFFGILDTEYLHIFLRNIAHNFLGNDVILSTGVQGKIIFINERSPSRPLVETMDHKVINLLDEYNLTIDKFL